VTPCAPDRASDHRARSDPCQRSRRCRAPSARVSLRQRDVRATDIAPIDHPTADRARRLS